MRVIVTKDYEELGRVAANIIAAQVTLKPDSVLGLATGSSPISTYQNLIKKYENGDLDFSKCHTANLDEYVGLTKDNDQSYAYFMYDNLFKHININKENVNIPVIGNGDILTCYDAKRMLDETGCDAIMIGRGVLGNPWLIKECIEYLEDKKEPKEVSVEEKINMIKYHIELLRKTKCDKLALLEIRSHASWYLKGIKNSSKLRTDICKAKNIEELLNLIEEFLREKKYES